MTRRSGLNPFWIALVIGVAARLALLLTSIGSNDVPFKILWAKVAREFGVAGYAYRAGMNHPPLSIYLFYWYDFLATRLGIEYSDLFRLVQVACDVVTAAVLLWIGKRVHDGHEPAIFYLLMPAAIFVSGFHCNTDPMMLMFIVLATQQLFRGRYLLAGVLFGLSFGIKIVALFAVPFAFIVLTRGRWRLAAGFALSAAAIFVPATLVGGSAVLSSVFGYPSYSGKWGLPALLLTIEGWMGQARQTALYQLALWYAENGKFLVMAALVAVWILYARRYSSSDHERSLLHVIPIAFLVFLTLMPAYGVQYLLWPLPFLPFALNRRMYAITAGGISAYQFITYTIWSGGFPWWYADSVAPSPWKPWVTYLGFPLWLWFGVVVVVSLRALLLKPAGAFPEPAASSRT